MWKIKEEVREMTIICGLVVASAIVSIIVLIVLAIVRALEHDSSRTVPVSSADNYAQEYRARAKKWEEEHQRVGIAEAEEERKKQEEQKRLLNEYKGKLAHLPQDVEGIKQFINSPDPSLREAAKLICSYRWRDHCYLVNAVEEFKKIQKAVSFGLHKQAGMFLARIERFTQLDLGVAEGIIKRRDASREDWDTEAFDYYNALLPFN